MTREINVIISDKFLNNVNVLHSLVKDNTEWCAITYFTIQEKNNVSIRKATKIDILLEDLYLMDIGSSAYTETMKSEFHNKREEIIKYFIPDIEIDPFDPIDINMGFVHSHHSMPTFFSGTDMAEIKENYQNFFPFYLSIIVNYSHNYNAKLVFLNSEEIIRPKYEIVIKDKFTNETSIKVLEEATEIRNYPEICDTQILFESGDRINSIVDRMKEITDRKKVVPTTISSKQLELTCPVCGTKGYSYVDTGLYCDKCGKWIRIDKPKPFISKEETNKSFKIENKEVNYIDHVESILELILTGKTDNNFDLLRYIKQQTVINQEEIILNISQMFDIVNPLSEELYSIIKTFNWEETDILEECLSFLDRNLNLNRLYISNLIQLIEVMIDNYIELEFANQYE